MAKSEYQKINDSKKKAKANLYKSCFPDCDPSGEALVAVFAPEDFNYKPFLELLSGMLFLPAKFIVICKSEPGSNLKKPTGKITWVNSANPFHDENLKQFLLAADSAVVFKEHIHDLSALKKYGIVPITHEKSPKVMDYHPNDETGNGFTFDSYNQWSIFMAITRALETFRFPYDWQHIVKKLY